METLQFYSYLWQKHGDRYTILGRSDRGVPAKVHFSLPGYGNLKELWLGTGLRPCAWYLIERYLPMVARPVGTMELTVDLDQLKLMSIEMEPPLRVLSVHDVDPNNVWVQIEYPGYRQIFLFGVKNVHDPLYIAADYRSYLHTIADVYRPDVEFYTTRAFTNAPLKLVIAEQGVSYYGLLSEYCLEANTTFENIF